ncbi:DUF488 family protein [Luteimonas kalidii]|uniref:DUF488 domain-containing protein n=1 Tax=Luteimonas kalidii TaxID=3042025 RepID=A0ABT6JP29_9GAMM|nr:DUF488 domain-containing protein [Luteimonas kalidii]MDH5832430.1 DUF488 domain-containing protein [Luteimonas kalidii]
MDTLWTIGHSTRPLEVFVQMLQAANVACVADVRRHPGSRRHPQFGADALATGLPAAGIGFVPMPELGGRRRARPDSPHTAWRNASFRGYADYMDTPGYAAARERLFDLARTAPTAVMCAEAMWWSCHRSLIADDAKARGWAVLHLMAPGDVREHPWTGAARIVGGRLDYTAPADAQGRLDL